MIDDTHDDEKFDQFLRMAARDYNAPPATPRAEMWARIAAARGEQRAAVTPISTRRAPTAWRWTAVVAGLAATLAIGFTIGRVSTKTTSAPGGSPSTVAANQTAPITTAPDSAPLATRRSPLAPSTARRDEPRVASHVDSSAAPDQSALAFRLAAIQHLGQSEALLTTVRADARAGRVDAQVSNWARDLLGNTQLLLDSPAADDPQLKRLLGDLELVLMQIARLPANGQRAARDTADIDLIEQAIAQHDVLTRIRTTIPAGRVPVGS